MPTLGAFQRVKRIEFSWEDTDEKLSLDILPDKFTGEALGMMQQTLEDDSTPELEQHRFLCKFLGELIKVWDLTDDDGTPIPHDGDTIFKMLPVTLVMALLDTVKKEMQVNPPTPES